LDSDYHDCTVFSGIAPFHFRLLSEAPGICADRASDGDLWLPIPYPLSCGPGHRTPALPYHESTGVSQFLCLVHLIDLYRGKYSIQDKCIGGLHPSIPPSLKSGWVYFHSSIAFLAYAAFFLTFVSGILYLIQEKELKEKNFRFLYFRLPSLQVCEELLQRSLFVGFVSMSLTIITGSIWAQQAWGRFWSWDPKETAALITWAIYLILVNYRLSSKWRVRRAAYISIAGFASTVFTFCVNWGLHRNL
jgi:cytochrome c-type biogenesis protein CcsB